MASHTPFKICRCKDPHTGKPLRNNCPRLRRANRSWNPAHGQWAYQLELPTTVEGRRRQLRPATGFDSQADAQDEIDHVRRLLDLAGKNKKRLVEIADFLQHCRRTSGVLPDVETLRQRLGSGSPLAGVLTVAEYLTGWIKDLEVDENTRRSYAGHITVHLIPHLGDIPLDQLRPHHVQTLIRKIKERNDDIQQKRNSPDPEVRKSVAGQRLTGEATRSRIRGTLRNAFNSALRLGVIAGVPNPAALMKTPNPRSKPIVWEPERVERWRATGEVPGRVMVWTDQLLAEFLDYAEINAADLYPMLHFVAYRGTRRGESCGLLDAEVRLGKAEVSIVNQIAVHGQTPHHKKPKSEAGNRDLILDHDTVAVLARYKAARNRRQLATGEDWPDTGLFFVRPDGRAWHPNSVSQRFRRLVKRGGFPPIRFHDLRHGAATIALEAGTDIKVVSEQLGHSSTTLTRDTYQSVTKTLHHDAAGAVAERINAKRRLEGI
ncbi:tyrosine-type recombinase/integrase [Actinoplanes awajinensis]|uniref:Integrase n=1 Tax=Actinoplanes awajinensis subsp. mycoplanecinus TaxID=135947 RepID=A0A101JQW8_9ACTN|nr:site-specific integrase [Actinoplanes awajinensis]KUL31409.1 integrase [Actinoplanes awajinensis subsp. mycoplanecinus]